MSLSVVELFTIGIGPSSSHTVGPMRAGARFVERLRKAELLDRVARVEAHLYGSLALTGKGHGTDKAVLLGLEGELPESVDIDSVPVRLERIRQTHCLHLGGTREIPFEEKRDLLFHRLESLPEHPNGLRFFAYDGSGTELLSRTYYSIGGGFVVNEGDARRDTLNADQRALSFPYKTGDDLLRMGKDSGLSISEMTLRNESAWRSEQETRASLLKVWHAMQGCVERGCHAEGTLPGGLKVQRRAPGLYRELTSKPEVALQDPLTALDWVSLWAMAVNEENAAGGRVVTAPTNGAAGILPATMHYLCRVLRVTDEDKIVRFLLTAGAIGLLYKLNASISGAEVGCQGEVGVACSMAAAALCEAQGGTVPQVENAAEIGMEHNLGLTCDPVGGLVQVPCIERNAMGAVKAIHAARLALHGDGTHRVSLDKVIATMRQTGADMSTKYKETSRGGLAVNVTEC
ncbi:L-serine dehydratase [Roseimicrobium gellanilyticum]|uniref:L-serine dehydratase n=1 Tax=Roseimicrobium gellanilyticum TaxID=748857 RepID=A0A366HA04_9BACT|nr:L-serine ammonia-lyase [Roseimicrobium gellanilyticum]RBP39100.1 L-serine dehydratase [Roseimicrobium gellanilyticum]